MLGPFGSIAAPLPVRIVSWGGFALLGYVFYRPMDPLATGRIERSICRAGRC